MADLGVSNERGDVGEQAALLPDQVGTLDVVVAREAADADLVALLADIGELGEGADVDEHRRRGEPELHEGQQRVTAGEDLGFVAVLGERGERLVDRAGPHVVERGRDHCPPPDLAAASTAWTMLW